MRADFSKYSDDELYNAMRKSQSIKERAFAEIYSRYSTQVYRYCKRILNNKERCDDIYQDTFLRFLKSTENQKEITNLLAYLLKIARNLCYDENRAKKYLLVSIEDLDFEQEDHQIESSELMRLISMALDLLSDKFREAFVLQAYNGMSYNEISEFLEVPVSTVRNWIVRAKRRIREILQPYLEGYTN